MKHPFAAILPPYVAGLLAAWGWMDLGWPPLAWLFGAAMGVAAWTLTQARWRQLSLSLLLFLAGWVNLAWRVTPLAPDDLRLQLGAAVKLASLRGVLVDSPTFRVTEKHLSPHPLPATNSPPVLEDQEIDPATYHTLATLKVSSIQISNRWRQASGLVLLTAPFRLADSFQHGCAVEVMGAIQPPPGPAAEGLFDYQAYLKWQGIYYQLRTDTPGDWKWIAPPPGGPPWVDRFFKWAQHTLAQGLPCEDEPLRLLWALTLGWKTALTQEVSEPFMRTGTMHVFAVSGLHIVLIAGVFVSLLRVFQMPRAYCGGIVIPLIWFYTGASGWQASAIRSTLMMTIVIGGWSLRRPGNLLNSLGAAGFLLLVYEPQQLFQASFQLSFFVVLSMGLLMPSLEARAQRCLQGDPLLPPHLRPGWRRLAEKPWRWFAMSLATSLGAWLGSLPIIAYYFHLLTPISLLANLVIVPLSSFALACNLGSLVCGAWLPGASGLFNNSAWLWMWLLVRLNHWLAELPGAFFYVPAPSWADFAAYYILVFGLFGAGWWASRGRKWLVFGFALYASWCGLRLYEARATTRIEVLALPGGDAILVSQPGHRLLIDGGNERAVHRLTRPLLAARGVNRLSQLVITHGDVRHFGGAPTLSADFKPRQIFVSPTRFRSPEYRHCLETWETIGGLLHPVAAGDSLGSWEVLHPQREDRFPLADDSPLVLRTAIFGTTVLLCSDLSPDGQNTLLERRPDLRADLVISGVPARGEPLTEAFLDRVRPRSIILNTAYYPAAEQAKPALRERLERRGIPVFYTCDEGSVTVEIRKAGWRLRAMNGRRIEGKAGSSSP
jgi:competence protein ComEC